VKHPKNLNKYKEKYDNDSSVGISIDTLGEMVAGSGHYSSVEKEGSEHAKEVVDELADRVRLDEKLLNIIKCLLIYGFCPVERIVRRGPPAGILELRILDPPTVKYHRSNKGKVDGYVQTIDMKTVDFKADELIWFVYNEVGNAEGVLYGRSKIQPIYDKLEIRDQIITNINGIMEHQARPPIIWKANTNQDKETLTSILNQRKAEEDLVIAPKDSFEHEVIQTTTKAAYWDYVKYVDLLIFEGLHAPLLNYLRNATEASANVMLDAIERHVQGIQRYLKRMVEHEIYEFHLKHYGWHGEIPTFNWGQPPTGVEDLRIEDFLTIGVEVGYLSRKQYFEVLAKAGMQIEYEELPGGEPKEEPPVPEEEPKDEEEPEVPPKEKPDELKVEVA